MKTLYTYLSHVFPFHNKSLAGLWYCSSTCQNHDEMVKMFREADEWFGFCTSIVLSTAVINSQIAKHFGYTLTVLNTLIVHTVLTNLVVHTDSVKHFGFHTHSANHFGYIHSQC